MAKNVLIVESPAKVKTIGKVLGKDFQVLASYGHVRDLPAKDGSVDPAHGFAMRYEVIERNQKHVDAIARAVKSADALYLATDLDREGEAIGWHLYEILRERGLLDGKAVYRVTFPEITPRAIRAGLAEPRRLSQELVNAQQARRALDYLVGFNLSPLLWRKVQPGLSAGRVQSPALRMIVEREEEIEAFVRREYWTLEADCAKEAQPFAARLTQLDGKKLEQFDLDSAALAHAARDRVLAAAQGRLEVADVQRRDRQRRPAAPFITSTLQQEAARKLGFSTSRTMRIAQQLYEGLPLEDGVQVGLITYMRTDSVHLSDEAIADLRAVITRQYGAEYLPAAPQRYQGKSKNAQEAHEAIRPTSAARTPAQVAAFLSAEQAKLYELIWKRSIASQMKPALLNTVSVDLAAGPHRLRASGTTIVDPGFLTVYEEGHDQKSGEDEEGARLPELVVGERIELRALRAEQHYTEPPPRYSEASLVKALEEYGIGRPSTYASIIQVLLAREYVTLEQRRFRPTAVGRVVAKFLASHFARYVDYEFTAHLEDELDAIARGEEDWVPVLERFWTPFKQLIDDKSESVSRTEAQSARVLGIDPVSGKPVSVRLGRFGPFVQIGSREDHDKPRFASLRPTQNMHTIGLEEALELFKLPRVLGQDAAGAEVTVGVGRFGPFVKAADQYASLGKEDDPYTLTLERALELLEAKRQAAAQRIVKRFPDSPIQIVNGRFGPYLTDGEKNARIPKDRAPESLSLAECQALLAAAPTKSTGRRRGSAGRGAAAERSTPSTPEAEAPRRPTRTPRTVASNAAAAKRTASGAKNGGARGARGSSRAGTKTSTRARTVARTRKATEA